MSFDIRFTDETHTDLETGTTSRAGVITVGTFRESFVSLLPFWDERRYERHWHDAVQRLINTDCDSCLISSIADPSVSEILFWWPMYRDGERVYVQNSILLYSALSSPFNPADPFSSVPPRTMINEVGERVSEWCVDLEELRAFLARSIPSRQFSSPPARHR